MFVVKQVCHEKAKSFWCDSLCKNFGIAVSFLVRDTAFEDRMSELWINDGVGYPFAQFLILFDGCPQVCLVGGHRKVSLFSLSLDASVMLFGRSIKFECCCRCGILTVVGCLCCAIDWIGFVCSFPVTLLYVDTVIVVWLLNQLVDVAVVVFLLMFLFDVV